MSTIALTASSMPLEAPLSRLDLTTDQSNKPRENPAISNASPVKVTEEDLDLGVFANDLSPSALQEALSREDQDISPTEFRPVKATRSSNLVSSPDDETVPATPATSPTTSRASIYRLDSIKRERNSSSPAPRFIPMPSQQQWPGQGEKDELQSLQSGVDDLSPGATTHQPPKKWSNGAPPSPSPMSAPLFPILEPQPAFTLQPAPRRVRTPSMRSYRTIGQPPSTPPRSHSTTGCPQSPSASSINLRRQDYIGNYVMPSGTPPRAQSYVSSSSGVLAKSGAALTSHPSTPPASSTLQSFFGMESSSSDMPTPTGLPQLPKAVDALVSASPEASRSESPILAPSAISNRGSGSSAVSSTGLRSGSLSQIHPRKNVVCYPNGRCYSLSSTGSSASPLPNHSSGQRFSSVSSTDSNSAYFDAVASPTRPTLSSYSLYNNYPPQTNRKASSSSMRSLSSYVGIPLDSQSMNGTAPSSSVPSSHVSTSPNNGAMPSWNDFSFRDRSKSLGSPPNYTQNPIMNADVISEEGADDAGNPYRGTPTSHNRGFGPSGADHVFSAYATPPSNRNRSYSFAAGANGPGSTHSHALNNYVGRMSASPNSHSGSSGGTRTSWSSWTGSASSPIPPRHRRDSYASILDTGVFEEDDLRHGRGGAGFFAGWQGRMSTLSLVSSAGAGVATGEYEETPTKAHGGEGVLGKAWEWARRASVAVEEAEETVWKKVNDFLEVSE